MEKLGGGSGPPTGKYENLETPERDGLPGLMSTEKGTALSSSGSMLFMLVTTHVVSHTSMERHNFCEWLLFLENAVDAQDRILRGNLLGLYQAVDMVGDSNQQR